MALVAVSNRDTEKFVSKFDPARTMVDVKINPDDKSKDAPTKKEEVIDYSTATIFHVGSLEVGLMSDIFDGAMNMGAHTIGTNGLPQMDVRMMINKTNVEAVRFGLRGWDNFQDAKGKQVKFAKETISKNGKTYEVVAPECMNCLDVELVQELAERIKARSRVTKAVEKNSDAA